MPPTAVDPNGAPNSTPNGFTGAAHTNGAAETNGNKGSNDDVRIPLNDQYAFTPRKLRVITIGAGFSGLLMAHKFQHRFPEMQEYVEHTILERHSDIGGTVGVDGKVLCGIGVSSLMQEGSGWSTRIRACSAMCRRTSTYERLSFHRSPCCIVG